MAANAVTIITPNGSTSGQGSSGPEAAGQWSMEPWRIVGDAVANTTSVIQPWWLRQVDYILCTAPGITDIVIDNTTTRPTVTITHTALAAGKIAYAQLYGRWR